MSFDHIPLEERRKNKPKTQADYHAKVNFPPFKHVSAKGREIARSHWKGDRKTGTFRVDHGYLTDHLAKMFIKLCDRNLESRLKKCTRISDFFRYKLRKSTALDEFCRLPVLTPLIFF